MMPSQTDILKVVNFKTSRSGGAGGQNVNKVSSKVELIFNIDEAFFFTENEKQLLKLNLANRLDGEGLLHIVSQEDRSQLMNKQRVVLKLIELLKTALKVQKVRKPTKIPKGVKEKRLKDKTQTSARKADRRKPSLD